MGRPQKLTLDFYIHDAHASDDRKVKRLERKFKNDGYATFFKVLERLCREKGMKLSLADLEDAEILAEECNLRDCHHLFAIIQFCTEIGLLNKQLWESERLVFSDSFQQRYIDRLEQRKSDAKRKRRSREVKALQGKIDSISPELSAVTIELSRDCHKGRPATDTNTEIKVQRSEDRDQKTEPHKEESCVSESPDNRCLAMEDRWASRKANRKGSPFDDAWEQYQRNCIVVDRSPGNKAQASVAWHERFPQGPTPEFLKSLDVYWQQQLNKFKSGQQCIGVVGMVRFISEPEHAEQAIARQQLLEQAPQLADPKATAQALKQQEEDRMWADLKAKGAA